MLQKGRYKKYIFEENIYLLKRERGRDRNSMWERKKELDEVGGGGKYISERENETVYGEGGEKETDRKRERRGKERHREPINVQYN